MDYELVCLVGQAGGTYVTIHAIVTVKSCRSGPSNSRRAQAAVALHDLCLVLAEEAARLSPVSCQRVTSVDAGINLFKS